jgi:hypothetical protein
MMSEEMKFSGCDLRCVEAGYVEIEREFAVDEGRKEEWRL